MITCPSCGTENPVGAKFCNECATTLTASVRTEERKVVTALFCDLVGFTAASESADPEDVDRMLDAYFSMARAAIESFGGIVEKFIGDAVVGVFGVPAAHEDDPERAIRAGLRIAEDAQDLRAVGGAPLKLRVGINTGEALVRLGIDPSSGAGFLTGDAVNTASRIQAIAPQMGVAVGLATYEPTSLVFEYEELEPANLKGKSEYVRVFHAKSSHARLGTDVARTHDGPFVGRELDVALLRGVFEKTLAASAVQFVTIVGEPGLGKSRLVAELGAYVDARPDLITWRQGRCLPYGEGITFWALGEILKAHVGIWESDPPDVARRKLDAVLPEGPDAAWFRQRLLPLIGIGAGTSVERDEQFTAWRRFLEHVAADRPAVLVFEDLHWADDAMLAFLEHLAGRGGAVPLLVVGTARPGLFDRYPGFCAGLPNTNVINLAPLSDTETTRLVSALLGADVVADSLKQRILDRAGGNPLYAGEFVHLLKDRELLVRSGDSWELRAGSEVPLPDSVQALIAARLDTLQPDAKAILASAAVVGKVFWAGAVASIGERDPSDVTETLRALSRKEFLHPSRGTSIEAETEYAFRHSLVRDVAYAQLPRASRATQHVAAARWIESRAPDRVQDLAGVLAHHYATAHELALATGQAPLALELEEPAFRFLTLAGERATGLDSASAVSNFEGALALMNAEDPERAQALVRFGAAAVHVGRIAEAVVALEEAVEALRAAGDVPATANAMLSLGGALRLRGDSRRWELPQEALAMLEPLPPGPVLVAALTRVAALEAQQGRSESAIRDANRALAMAEYLGIDPPLNALGFRGHARVAAGDPAGLEDSRTAIAIGIESGEGSLVPVLYNLLANDLRALEGPGACLGVLREAVSFSRARGLELVADNLTSGMLEVLFEVGELDEAIKVAAALAERLGEDDVWDLIEVRTAQIRILDLRGQQIEAAKWLDWFESASRAAGGVQNLLPCLATCASVRSGLGEPLTAAALLTELDATPGAREIEAYAVHLPEMVRTGWAIGAIEISEHLIVGVEPRHAHMEHALVAANATLSEARGDLIGAVETYADAAARWERFGVVPELGVALLGQGRCLLALSRSAEARPVLQHAREISDRLQAAPALAEIDALLQQATALSS